MAVVLEHYGINQLRRSGRDQMRGRCPLHRGEGRDTFHANTAQAGFPLFLVRSRWIGVGPGRRDRAL